MTEPPGRQSPDPQSPHGSEKDHQRGGPGSDQHGAAERGARSVRRVRKLSTSEAVVAAVVGALITGIFTLLGVWLSGSHSGSPEGSQGVTTPASSQPPASLPATQLAPSGPGSLPAVPAIFIGHWTGTLAPDSSLANSELVELTISGGHLASVVGRSTYPTVGNGCTGKLTLENAAKDEVTLQEVYPLTGINSCIPDTMILSPAGSQLSCKVYEGGDAVGTPFFTGTLRRVTSFS